MQDRCPAHLERRSRLHTPSRQATVLPSCRDRSVRQKTNRDTRQRTRSPRPMRRRSMFFSLSHLPTFSPARRRQQAVKIPAFGSSRGDEALTFLRRVSRPGSRQFEPPTPKMGLEETLALTPALSPRRGGKHAQFPGIFTPFGVELLHGDSRRLLLLKRAFIPSRASTRPGPSSPLQPYFSISVSPPNARSGSGRSPARTTIVRRARVPGSGSRAQRRPPRSRCNNSSRR